MMKNVMHFIIRHPENTLREIIVGIINAAGILWLVVSLSNFFFPTYTSNLQQNWLIFLIPGLLWGIYQGRPKLAIRSIIEGTDASIEIIVGDLFDQEGTVVVAAPTSFDNSMDDNTIDKKSIQGQYIVRYCDSMDNLNQQINSSLKGIDFDLRDKLEKPYGSQRRYPVGTVANVVFNGKKAYFVALATLNEHKKASLTWNDLLDGLPRLWESIRLRGSTDPINVPILGSGFSRVNATREELVREIIKSFIAAIHSGCFCENLKIVISNSDFIDRKVDLDQLGSFLEHECTYGISRKPEEIGTPI